MRREIFFSIFFWIFFEYAIDKRYRVVYIFIADLKTAINQQPTKQPPQMRQGEFK